MSDIAADIRKKVKQLLKDGTIKYFIGYEGGSDSLHATPCFIRKAEEADTMIWNPLCVNNLVTYLTHDKKRELKKGEKQDTRPIGILVKGCDSKSLVQLLSEHKIERGDVVIFGVPCRGVIDPVKLEKLLQEKNLPLNAVTIHIDEKNMVVELDKKRHSYSKDKLVMDKCRDCTQPNTLIYDEFFGEKVKTDAKKDYKTVKEIEALPLAKRWKFWSDQFAKCIRCSACKNVCPVCYCKECAVDSADLVITPQTSSVEKANKMPWLEKNVDLAENIFFHLTRMMHMAGRCINCGECERACPMNIPLSLLTKKLEKEVKEMFDYEAGIDVEAKPLLSIFEEGDPGDFIK